jgi:6-phosphogluconate dehydrogenase
MRVGLIGLGRMGEGMSRRLIKAGHEVWGYRNNYEKACEQYEKGYISGCTTSLESLVQMIHSGGSAGQVPGVFMMVVPAETVEDTINELLQFCVEGDIIIDHGNSNFKDTRRRAERLAKLGIQYLDCGTSGGVYGLERGYCLMVGGADTAVSVCSPLFRALAPGIGAAPRTDPLSYSTSAEYGWLHCGPAGAGHFVKMVQVLSME